MPSGCRLTERAHAEGEGQLHVCSKALTDVGFGFCRKLLPTGLQNAALA